MNWRRGLFRLWLLLSVLWGAAVCAYVYEAWWINPWRVVSQTDIDCLSPNPPGPWCNYRPKTFSFEQAAADLPRPLWVYVIAAVGLPAGSFAAALGIFWIMAGFRGARDRARLDYM
jgi:hypothetical protein